MHCASALAFNFVMKGDEAKLDVHLEMYPYVANQLPMLRLAKEKGGIDNLMKGG